MHGNMNVNLTSNTLIVIMFHTTCSPRVYGDDSTYNRTLIYGDGLVCLVEIMQFLVVNFKALVRTSDYGNISAELKRIWEEAVKTQSRHYLENRSGEEEDFSQYIRCDS
jgi:hypothetical protein